MTQPHHLTANIFAIEVAEDASNFRIGKSTMLKNRLYFDLKSSFYYGGDRIDLPPGTWQIIGMVKEVTNMQLAEILDHAFIGDYYAIDSLYSLLASKGLEPERTLLIKKE